MYRISDCSCGEQNKKAAAPPVESPNLHWRDLADRTQGLSCHYRDQYTTVQPSTGLKMCYSFRISSSFDCAGTCPAILTVVWRIVQCATLIIGTTLSSLLSYLNYQKAKKRFDNQPEPETWPVQSALWQGASLNANCSPGRLHQSPVIVLVWSFLMHNLMVITSLPLSDISLQQDWDVVDWRLGPMTLIGKWLCGRDTYIIATIHIHRVNQSQHRGNSGLLVSTRYTY